MNRFVLVRERPVSVWEYLFTKDIEMQSVSCCDILWLPVCSSLGWIGQCRRRYLERLVQKKTDGVWTILDSSISIPGLSSPFSPDPGEVLMQYLESAFYLAKKQFSLAPVSDLAIVCDEIEEPYVTRVLDGIGKEFSVVWIFTHQEEQIPEDWTWRYPFSVFCSRDLKNLSTIPVVVLLGFTGCWPFLNRSAVAFSVSDRPVPCRHVVRGVAPAMDRELMQLGLPIEWLAQVLFLLDKTKCPVLLY